MTNSLRSFGSFCIFFSSTFLIMWPYALVLGIGILGLPLYLYWHSDFLQHIQLLLQGQMVPENDLSLVFFIPALVLFGTPFLACSEGSELMACHKMLYSDLLKSMMTPYGFIGWVITISVMIALIAFSLWGVRKILDLSWSKSAQYFAIFMMLSGLIIWVI